MGEWSANIKRSIMTSLHQRSILDEADGPMNDSSELLTSLDIDELAALADSKLALSAQDRLNELLAKNNEGNLTGDEAKELDFLLARGDQLTILKTRARYTLQQQAKASGR